LLELAGLVALDLTATALSFAPFRDGAAVLSGVEAVIEIKRLKSLSIIPNIQPRKERKDFCNG
jgi:hypothetical protein